PVAPQHAVQYLVETLRAAPRQSVTICALGPLTNLATALTEAPEIRDALREIVLMGGAFFERGNITPAAEFNVYVDPEAARIVLASGVPIVVLPRDVAVKAPITPARIEPFRALGNRCGKVVADIMAAEVAYQNKRRGGKIITAFDVARTLAIGADWVNSARGFMFAVGCIQAQTCHTGRCPTGGATPDGGRQRELVVPGQCGRGFT
ncbi:nucleoside hydrolase, partial [Burkholderia gladioli]|nr:nucleoside hydrolase [Burkholderia gladioli]